VESHYMVFHLVDGVRASSVELICEMEFVRYVIRGIHALMILLQILLIALPTPTILHTPHTRLTRMIHMEMTLNLVMIVSLSSRLTMSQNKATMKTILLILSTDEPRFLFSCFDQPQPPQSSVIHQPPQELSIQEMEDLKQQYLDELKRLNQFEDFSESNNEVSLIDDDSFSIVNIDYFEASPPDSELVSSEVMEIVIPKTKSSSTSLNSLLEETNTFNNSLPKFKNFYFDLGDISSGSTTTHSHISLPDYEAFSFNNDYIKEISSRSTTTYFDISLSEYDSFIFDLTQEKFVDELAHIISPPEYDCIYFGDLPNPGELMSVLNSGIRKNLLSTTLVNLPTDIPGNLKTLAKGFYPPCLNFLNFNWESCILILSTNVYLLAYFINGLRFT
nr:hypothetical protein [Tanacetum cinerariifolium]